MYSVLMDFWGLFWILLVNLCIRVFCMIIFMFNWIFRYLFYFGEVWDYGIKKGYMLGFGFGFF